jgi:hypothetical protein
MTMSEEEQIEALAQVIEAPPTDFADELDELDSVRPFIALEGKSGKPLFLRRFDVVAVYFDADGDLCVSTEQGSVFALSEQSGNRMLAWASSRAEVLEQTEEGS